MIYRYDIPSKKIEELAQVPLNMAIPLAYDSNQKKLLIGRSDISYSGIMDIEKETFIRMKGFFPLYNAQYIITHDTACKKIYCYRHDGTLAYQLSHDPTRVDANESTAKISPNNNYLATILGNDVIISDLKTGDLLKKITYENKIGACEFISNNELVASVLHSFSDKNCYNLLLTNLDTGAYRLLAKDVYIKHQLSADAMLYLGGQHTPEYYGKYSPTNILNHCFMQKTIKIYPTGVHEYLSPDASYCLFSETDYGQDKHPYICYTHRVITNNAILSEPLALLIVEKQHTNNTIIDTDLIEELKKSKAKSIQHIAEKYASLLPTLLRLIKSTIPTEKIDNAHRQDQNSSCSLS